MPDIKVTSAHLERDAYLYIRQSTARQVIENTESTRRQYALRERAVTYGWPLERIHVIDNDLGKSGASAQHRDGFQELVSEVALGKAGIVMGLEVSRLARNSADWHRLIELCAMGGTLILDQDGTYDPTCFNDRLVLGLKGTMSEAELHILKARMRGGVLNKARRGELEMMPPVGLVYQDNGVLGLDPDASVQAALQLVFDTFEHTGSAFQSVRRMVDDGLRFPCRQRVGEKKGDLTWAVPNHSRILQVLRNPRYAGAFVYGRTRARPQPNGRTNQKRLPVAEWQFVFPESHVGYISWDRYLANQQRLAANATAFGKQRASGPVREGPALLQGRVLCGICGAHMTMQYNHVREQLVPIYMCQEDSVRRGRSICQQIRGVALDQAISALLIELMTPMAVDIALAVQQEIEARIGETDELRRTQLERARYEAELARRRYMKADPDNRLVVNNLEAEWNDKLRLHLAAQEDYEQQTEKERRLIDTHTRQQLLSLVEDFPRVWNDPSVEPRERKRIVRLLIEDVTLIKTAVITAHVRLRGGATRTLTVPVGLPAWMLRKTPAAIVSAIDELLDTHSEVEITAILNERGHRTYRQIPYTLDRVVWLRDTYKLKSRRRRLQEQGFGTIEQLRRRLGVSQGTIKRWRKEGLLPRKYHGNDSRCLYGTPDNIDRLKASPRHSMYAQIASQTQTRQ
jgi:DNA invertase Pin-like site-specific DNA recombinase